MRRLIVAAALLLGGCGTFADPTEWLQRPNVVKPSGTADLENTVQLRRSGRAISVPAATS